MVTPITKYGNSLLVNYTSVYIFYPLIMYCLFKYVMMICNEYAAIVDFVIF